MSVKYTYTKLANTSKLQDEIQKSTVVTALDFINSYIDGGYKIDIWFKSSLSPQDEVTVAELVENHIYEVKWGYDGVIPNPKTPDNRDVIAINRIPIGYTMYFTGRSDNIAAGTYSNGNDLCLDEQATTKIFQSLNHFYLVGGRAIWENASLANKVTAKLIAPATTGLVNQQGDYTKVEVIPGSGFNIIVPTPLGFGNWELELSAKLPNTNILKCVPVPAIGNDGFFDYNSDTNVLTRNETGTGSYNLFDFPIRLFTFVNEMPGKGGSGQESVFESTDVVGKLLFNFWQVQLELINPTPGVKCCPVMCMAIKTN